MPFLGGVKPDLVGAREAGDAGVGAPSTSQTPAHCAVDGAQMGSSHHGRAPAASSVSWGVQTSSGSAPRRCLAVARTQASSRPPNVSRSEPGMSTAPGICLRVLSRIHVARSRTSTTRTRSLGRPGASIRPPAQARSSHHGSLRGVSCGPTMTPGRTSRQRPGKTSATARSDPALSTPYGNPPGASGGQSWVGESSATGALGQSR